jgi:hypothetical protein
MELDARATSDLCAAETLKWTLTDQRPFGPGDTEGVAEFGRDTVNCLFDRNNLVYAQTVAASRPTYIVGRKGAGKTAFLLGSELCDGTPTEYLATESVYLQMSNVLQRCAGSFGQLFVDQRAEIWRAVFDHVAVFHASRTGIPADSHRCLQTLRTYLGDCAEAANATVAVERFLIELRHRIGHDQISGLAEIIHDLGAGDVRFGAARAAMKEVLAGRSRPLTIVMDNLEDLHLRLDGLTEVLSGLFRCVGKVINSNHGGRPYSLRICLPSEVFHMIHEIAAAPEKDLQGSYLRIYWTAPELLKLTGNRFRLYLQAHHPDRLAELLRRADAIDEPEQSIALLRAALPPRIRGGLDIDEDPLAYVLRHTQLLPRHLIVILNSIFAKRDNGSSSPWAVTPEAVISGTRHAEHMLVLGILNAYKASFPQAAATLKRLADRIDICFHTKQLHRIYNQEGIRKATGLDFDEFLSMLFTLGAVGVRFDQTDRYNKAHFQYTFDYDLTAREDIDHLCVHPLFTRYLHSRSIRRLRTAEARATYPHGCDPTGGDYRHSFGYL